MAANSPPTTGSTSPAAPPSSGEAPTDRHAVDDHGGWSHLFGELVGGRSLTRAQARAAMTDVLAGRASPARISALLVGLRAKGETVEELAGLAEAVVAAAEPLNVDPAAIDIVGTGGSGHRRTHALNVSTMASIVAASAGAIVCKHGNRRISSTSGSFDFLEALGVAVDLTASELEACVAEVGLGFAFARSFHPAFRFAGPVRAELGIPTVFNLLGPLAHPGRVTKQVIGVASEATAQTLAGALQALGTTSAWVVAGADGLDELSTTGDSTVYVVSPAGVTVETVVLDSLGLPTVTAAELAGGTPADNVAIFEGVLAGRAGPHRDIVLLNAAAGLVVAGRVDSLGRGLEEAAAAVDDGRARATLDRLIAVTNDLVNAAR